VRFCEVWAEAPFFQQIVAPGACSCPWRGCWGHSGRGQSVGRQGVLL